MPSPLWLVMQHHQRGTLRCRREGASTPSKNPNGRKPSAQAGVLAQNPIRLGHWFAGDGFGRRFSLIRTERCPLSRSEHNVSGRGILADARGSCRLRRRPGSRRRCRLGRPKQVRLRDARSDGAGRRPVGRRQRCRQRAAVRAEARGNPWRVRDACGFGGDTQSMSTAHGAGDAHRRR